jgi:DNA polymerase-1
MDLLDTAKVGEYASEDAAVTLELMDRINPLIEETGLSDLLEAMEIPLIGVLARMEMNGIKIDRKLLSKLSADFGEKLDSLAERIQEMAEIKFNINSPKQLSYVLFDKMGIKPVRRTKTGFSTDEAVLVKLAESGVEMVSILLEYRKLSKLRSTYIDALPKMINVKTGRIHSSFNQTITSTGRLSSSDPNLRNIPVRTPEGRMIRKAFIVEADNAYILSADYSQIELRLMAHISGDESMIEAFMNDEDIHRATAARLFGITPEDVGDDERRRAKTVNFGVMYGMGEYGLAKRLGISVREAAGFIEEYFCKYPGIKDYINRTIKEAGEKGFTTTLLGRKRFLREINSSRKQVREAAERAAINMPIQGTAADLIKLAMLSIDEILLNEKYSTKMLLQVHDELVFEVPGSELDRIREMVQRVMSSVYPLKVPLKVDLGWGKNWLEAH